MSILGKIGSAIEGSSLGRVTGALTDKDSYSNAFKSTPLGGLVSGSMGGGKAEKDDKKSGDAEKVEGGSAGGLSISKETLNSLKAIDESLNNLINFLEDKKDADKEQKQKEETAAEEQKTESEIIDAEPIKGEGGGGSGGMLKQFGKLAGIVAVLVVQFAYPLYKAVMNLKDKFIEGFKAVKDFFVDKILPVFTEDIPEFFTETIPEFFTETLPEKFFAGMDFISEKFSSIADLFSGTVAGIKKKIGEFIVGLSETSVFKLFPETQNKVKSFGEDLVKSGNTTLDEISARQKQSADDAQSQTSAMAEAQPNSAAANTLIAQSIESTKSKLTPFEKEFAKQRRIQGPGGVFSWTDPATGKTGKYTTDYAEENAASPVSKATIENSGQAGKEYGSAPSSDTVDSSAAAPVTSTPSLNIPSGGGGGGGSTRSGGSSGTAEPSSPTSGNDVSTASMQATAPTSTPSAIAQQNSKGMNMSKAKSDDVNPVANVPEVDVDLGSISNLWYHRAAA
jgi:hypothetical protein